MHQKVVFPLILILCPDADSTEWFFLVDWISRLFRLASLYGIIVSEDPVSAIRFSFLLMPDNKIRHFIDGLSMWCRCSSEVVEVCV